ncbi:MAG TPA: hypothetical protein VKR31_01215 [Rhizomicrobium sp.]|nr:hypothetical protein [Rhizomicrobium sp.]
MKANTAVGGYSTWQNSLRAYDAPRLVEDLGMVRARGFFNRLSGGAERSGEQAGEHDVSTQSETSHEGQVGGIVDGAIVGWAWDSKRPYDPLEVELYSGGILLARGKADRFDIDLARARRGNGLHRFELRLERLPGQAPPFVIRAVIAGTERELHPAITITTLQQAEDLLSGSEYIGRITGIENGMISGWVYNRRNPHELPVLTLRIGGNPVLSLPAGDQVVMADEEGTTNTVYRFRLPLPANVADGQLHVLSVSAGNTDRELAGSPVLFGPSDLASMSRGLIMTADRLTRIERRLDLLPVPGDIVTFENSIISRLLARFDTLLNIHRDGVERELALLRRQISDLMTQVPIRDPDVIEPAEPVTAIDAHTLQPESAFTPLGRSMPLAGYELEEPTAAVKLYGAFGWPKRGKATGILIAGDGRLELDRSFDAKVSIVLSGRGARSRTEFQGMVVAANGSPMSGRFDMAANGDWTFIGTQIDAAPEGAARGISIKYLPDIAKASGEVSLHSILVFGAGRAPEHVGSVAPEGVVINVGGDNMGHGWYPVEPGARGGYCWMGEEGVISVRVRQSGFYRVAIPEIRPLSPDIISRMHVSLFGEPLKLELSARPEDSSTYRAIATGVAGRSSEPDSQLRISFPRDAIKSPMQLGLNNDLRPLSIAIRSVAVDADEPPHGH